jgi:hypothetical protein
MDARVSPATEAEALQQTIKVLRSCGAARKLKRRELLGGFDLRRSSYFDEKYPIDGDAGADLLGVPIVKG